MVHGRAAADGGQILGAAARERMPGGVRVDRIRERFHKFHRGGIAFGGALGKGFPQDHFHLRGERGVEALRRHGIFAHDAVEQRRQVVRDERLFSGEYFVGDHGERELVRAAIHGVALHLFGRHVIRSSHHDAALGHLLGENFGHAEIGDFRERAFVNENIGGLDIAVYDAFFVGVIERQSDLPKNGKHAVGEQRLGAVQNFFERRAIHELHEYVGQAVFLGNIVDGDDIGMGEDAGGLGFAKQAFAQPVAFGFVGEVREANGFYGDNAADGGVLSPVNDSRCTASEFV